MQRPAHADNHTGKSAVGLVQELLGCQVVRVGGGGGGEVGELGRGCS